MNRHNVSVDTGTLVRAALVVIGAWTAILVTIKLAQPIAWVSVAAFLALGLEPVIKTVARYLGGRRGWAIVVVTLVLLGLFALVLARLVPPLVEQTQTLITNLPEIKQQIKNDTTFPASLINQFNVLDIISDNREKIAAAISGALGAFFTNSMNLMGAICTIFILMVYFITGGPRWIATLKRSRWGHTYLRQETTLQKMMNAISSYVVGNAITSAIAFTAAFIMLVALGIDLPLPLAFLYGIFDIIPIVGATLGGIVLVGVALFKSWTAAIIMLIFVLVYQQAETSFLQPKVYGKALALPDVIIMLAAIAGGALAGLIGALLAIPLAACIRVAVLAYLDTHPPKTGRSPAG